MDLNQVTVPCTDYAASVRFYRTLGLRHIVDSPPRYARFETEAGTTLSIHAVAAGSPKSDVIIYFEVDNVDLTIRMLTERGLEFETAPKDDPSGNRLCIYHAGENRRNPPWRIS